VTAATAELVLAGGFGARLRGAGGDFGRLRGGLGATREPAGSERADDEEDVGGPHKGLLEQVSCQP